MRRGVVCRTCGDGVRQLNGDGAGYERTAAVFRAGHECGIPSFVEWTEPELPGVSEGESE